ncbi:hypothetical protein LguiA_000766 [Lonicera macranthoides]
MLSYGCTQLEIVQSTYEDVACDTNRGHIVAAVAVCFCLAKDAGFKESYIVGHYLAVAHMMPDLPNVGVERDLESFKEFFESPLHLELMGLRETGSYIIILGLISVLELPACAACRLSSLYPSNGTSWTRVYRVQRDIPMPLVTSGVEKGNLRELALARMDDLGLKC